MTDLKIYRDVTVDSQVVSTGLIIPVISSTDAPAILIPDGIAYDAVSKSIWYCNGLIWQPITGSSGGSTVDSYAFTKSGNMAINPNVSTIITSWVASPVPPYHSLLIGGWNLTTGVFTAPATPSTTKLIVDVTVSWLSGGIGTNQGTRTVKVMYNDGSMTTVAQAICQPEPNNSIPTTQTIYIPVYMNAGDQVWIEVEQTSSIVQTVSGGNGTTLGGIQIT